MSKDAPDAAVDFVKYLLSDEVQKGFAERGTRCAAAGDESVNFTDKTLSFRCCRDVDAPPAPTTPPAP